MAKDNMVGVEYVGKKPRHYDHLYGSGLTWDGPGDIKNVPAKIAEKMAKHTDVYLLGEPIDNLFESEGFPSIMPVDYDMQEEQQEEKLPPVLPNLEGMDKNALVIFAQQRFGEKLSRSMRPETMRSRILTLIQARGLK